MTLGELSQENLSHMSTTLDAHLQDVTVHSLGRASPGCYGPFLVWIRDHPKGRRTQDTRNYYKWHTLPKAPSSWASPVVDRMVSGAPYS